MATAEEGGRYHNNKSAVSTGQDYLYRNIRFSSDQRTARFRPLRLTRARLLILIVLIIFGAYGLLQILSGNVSIPISAFRT